MAHFALGKDWMGRLLHGFAMAICDLPPTGDSPNTFKISAGENLHHARHRRSGCRIDPLDARMRQF